MKVLKFGAIWCTECLVMRDIWEKVVAEVFDLEIVEYDTDEHPDILKKYNITDIPVYIFLDKNDNEIERMKGAKSKDDIINLINNINK